VEERVRGGEREVAKKRLGAAGAAGRDAGCAQGLLASPALPPCPDGHCREGAVTRGTTGCHKVRSQTALL